VGLGYQVSTRSQVTMPAFDGAIRLDHVVPAQPAAS
jgi:hypothetical protein